MDNQEQLKKLSKIFNIDKVVSQEDIEAVLKGILGILANNKKENLALNSETKQIVNELYRKIRDSVSPETLKAGIKVSAEFEEKMKEVKSLMQEVLSYKAKDGYTPKKGVDYFDGKDGVSPSASDVVPLVLAKIPKPKPLTRLDLVREINRGGDLKIDLTQLEDTSKMESKIESKILNRALGILDQRTQFLINKGVKHDSTLTGDGTDASPLSAVGDMTATWGSITGTLADQTDLQTALDAKLPLAGGIMTGNILMSSNKIIGGSTTTSDLFLQTTTGVGTTGADMHFLVGNNGATEAMTILNSGFVGIGTTAPTNRLHIVDSPANSQALAFSVNSLPTAPHAFIGATNKSENLWITAGAENTGDANSANGFTARNNDAGGAGTAAGIRVGGSGGIIDFFTAAGLTNGATFSWDAGASTGLVMRISQAGRVGIGTSAPAGLLHVSSDTAAAGIYFAQANDSSDAIDINFRKARGTAGTPTIITTVDELGVINFLGYDGNTGYRTGASIKAISSGTIADTRVPAQLSFWTGTDATPSVLTRRMTINEAGNVGIGTANQSVRLSFGTTNDQSFYLFENAGGANAYGFKYTSANGTLDILANGGTVAVFKNAGNVGFGVAVPTAVLNLKAGTATASTAPLKFTTGTLNTTAEAGAMEYNNTPHFTNSDATRRHIVLAASATKTTAAAPYTNDGYITINIGGTDVKVMTTA